METLEMSGTERRRVELLSRVRDGQLTLVKAAELMQVSYRQAKRVYARYLAEGDAGIVHGLRGRRSNRRIDPALRQRVLDLYREKYPDFGPTLAVEYLARDDGEVIGVETLRGWLLEEGLRQRRRRRPVHRKWRERRAHFGELVQMDGSHHDWFEGRRAWAVLMVMIDDATNETYARFFEGETTEAAFETFGRYVQRYGLPQELYPDRASIYRTTRDATIDENLAGEPPPTQFGRAMKELGVRLTLANSPQAKGRVERQNGVLQDRLVKALRLKGISTLERANEFLEQEFLRELNGKFALEPRDPGDLHRRVPRGVRLDRVLAFQEQRVVQNDWTIQWRNRWFQLTKANQKLALVRRQILVVEQLDGRVCMLMGKRELAYEELPKRPARRRKTEKKSQPPDRPTPRKPAADHPWRRAAVTQGE